MSADPTPIDDKTYQEPTVGRPSKYNSDEDRKRAQQSKAKGILEVLPTQEETAEHTSQRAYQTEKWNHHKIPRKAGGACGIQKKVFNLRKNVLI